MLTAFRKFGTTPAAKGLLVVLIISFAAWGIGDYLTSTTRLGGASVNGEEISLSQLDTATRRQAQQLSQFLGRAPSPEQLLSFGVPQGVLQGAISRVVLRQTAEDLGLLPAPAALRAEIETIPQFQQNGVFDLATYQSAVRSLGVSVAQFEKDLAGDLSVRALATLVRVPTPAPALTQAFVAGDELGYTLEIFTIPASAVAASPVAGRPAPTDAELAQFYAQNQQVYATPEKRSLDILRLEAATLARQISLTDAQIAAHYEANKASYAEPERRLVRHVLYGTEAEAKAAASRIKTLAEFTQIASTEGQDTAAQQNGGSLGEIAKADVVPAFGVAAFNAPPGQLAGPVKTEFGWHVLWVEQITPARTPALNDIRARVVAEATQPEAEAALQDVINRVADGIAAGKSLAELAREEGLQTERLSLITQDSDALPAAFKAVAFETPQGDVSQPIDLPDGGLAYVQITAIEPSRVPPLAEIKPRVLADATAAASKLAQRALAEQVLGAARASKASLAAAAQAQNVQGTVENPTVRGLENIPGFLQNRWAEITALPTGGLLPGALETDNGFAAVRLAARVAAPPPTPEALQTATGALRERLQSDAEALLIQHLTAQARIETNLPRLQQLFGEGFSLNAPAQ